MTARQWMLLILCAVIGYGSLAWLFPRYDPAARTLATDPVEERMGPDKQTFRYSDVMEVKNQGRTLWNYTNERDGQHYDGLARPMRSFTKVANSVADPPRGEGR